MESHQPQAPGGILLWFILIAIVLFLRTLRSTLDRCAPASRTMAPGKVWLTFIPFFGLIWQFVVVINIAKSLRKEFARLRIPRSDAIPGQTIGLAFCVCNCCLFIPNPLLCGLAALVGFVLWMVYWIEIANCSRLLETHPGVTPASTIA